MEYSVGSVLLGLILALTLPVISTAVWSAIFLKFVPEVKEALKDIYWKDQTTLNRVVVGGTFGFLCFVFGFMSIIIGLTIELIFFGLILLFERSYAMSDVLLEGIMVVIAGPAEETSKFLCAIPPLALLWILQKKNGNKVLPIHPIIAGVCVGAVFGLFESFTYIFAHVVELYSEGWDLLTFDMLYWRVILGVSVHAVMSGIACSGMIFTRPNTDSVKGSLTSLMALGTLLMAIVIHSTINFVFLTNYVVDGIWGLLIGDLIQLCMIIAMMVFFYKLVRTKGSNSSGT